MEDYTKVRVELEIAAQRLISQYMLNNKEIEKQLEAVMKKADELIDSYVLKAIDNFKNDHNEILNK